MGKIFKFLLDEFLYNGHLQSLSGASIVYIATLILGLTPNLIPSLIIYLAFQIIHVHDRYKDIRLDRLTNFERTKHLELYLDKIPFILIFLFLVLLFFLLRVKSANSFIFISAIVFFGLLYPVFFKSLTRKLYFFKNFYVSSVYLLLPFYPLIYYKVENQIFLNIFAVLVFLECLIGQAVLDLKDIASDKKNGYLTLGVMIGKERAINILRIIGLSLVLAIFLILINLGGNEILFFLVFISFLVNYTIFSLLAKNNPTAYLLAAGRFFLWLVLLFAVNIVVWTFSLL